MSDYSVASVWYVVCVCVCLGGGTEAVGKDRAYC